MRRNRRNNRPNDIFGGLDEILEAWLEMAAMMPQLDTIQRNRPEGVKKPLEGTMSYEERDDDIVFTIDMPGVSKKDIDINVEDHSITVKAENGGKRKYNYSRKFKPSVDIDSAKATFRNGVLDISLTKIEEKSKGKSVKIQ